MSWVSDMECGDYGHKFNVLTGIIAILYYSVLIHAVSRPSLVASKIGLKRAILFVCIQTHNIRPMQFLLEYEEQTCWSHNKIYP
ncbi:hypothetical protein [Sphingobacterium paludis]|uniref:hypothetical protein n=1 Tax=Sphingobacterium paludis TaxID=1476465 RepID=UPI00105DB72C|nr:hypothetical protein [Sphingobacterium paludis]